MDKQKAIQKINACLAIYKDPGAQPGEKEAAWERANFIAKKHGFKIVKQEKKEYRTYGEIFDDMFRSAWQRAHEARTNTHDYNGKHSSSSIHGDHIRWFRKNQNGRRMNDVSDFFNKFGINNEYVKSRKIIEFVVKSDKGDDFFEFVDRVYEYLDRRAIKFSKECHEYLRNTGRDITSQQCSKLFSYIWKYGNSYCFRGTKIVLVHEFIERVCPELNDCSVDLFNDVIKDIEKFRKEAEKFGR